MTDLFISVNACSGLVAVTVTDGPVPRFIWRPDCGVGIVEVEEVERRRRWTLVANGAGMEANSIGSGVVFGARPPATRAAGDLNTIDDQRSYRVTLYVVDGHGARTRVGAQSFGR